MVGVPGRREGSIYRVVYLPTMYRGGIYRRVSLLP